MTEKPRISTAELLASLRETSIGDREEGWVTLAEAAEAMGVSDSTAHRTLSDRGWERKQARINGRRGWVYRPKP